MTFTQPFQFQAWLFDGFLMKHPLLFRGRQGVAAVVGHILSMLLIVRRDSHPTGSVQIESSPREFHSISILSCVGHMTTPATCISPQQMHR